ncbi:hypothetical protein IW261DRAFT_1670955 [Armillaria novae-zelandiae]|uniref:Tyrosinase copper-binding domain-containing protein n=1 Tax=Armillaria novae-zelandiae TaxID=153914 RepID=A0AA39NTJ8_9AGAR|nr:hypothetical protein IW261DRAFT_1670955 [Armillaria novae-zelandiae]
MLLILSRLFLFIMAGAQLSGLLVSAKHHRTRPACKELTTRVEWNTLTEQEKADYFAAELCLLAAPAQTSIADVASRYGDLVSPSSTYVFNGKLRLVLLSLQILTLVIQVHRYYVFAHETLLRTECGYTGALPYWNEVVDAGTFSASPVVLDFGGEGTEENNWAVVDGPFANLTLYLGPGTTNTVHPLTRQANESVQAGQQFVDAQLAIDTFAAFKDTMRPGLHFAGHKGVGGEMGNVVTSPNDPIFWLHHGYVDYIWWKWQGDNETRIHDLQEIGYETQREPDTGYVETTADTVLYSYDVLPNATVGDMLDTKRGFLCYTYV